MKLVKLMSLTACAALAAMAFVGVSSAVAHTQIDRCTSGETGCELATVGTTFVATAEDVTLQNKVLKNLCKSGSVSGKVTVNLAEGAGEIKAEITAASFTECELPVTVENIPWILETSDNLFKANLTALVLKAKVTLHKVPLLGLCTFNETATDMPIGTWANGNPSVVTLGGSLQGSGFCGLGEISGKYKVTSVAGIAGHNIVILHKQ